MEKILNLISAKMADAFEAAGFDRSYGRVTVSNRPDLCEYQCNGALAAAKAYHKAPIQIAQAVAEQLHHEDFESVATAMPGFINLRVSGSFLQAYLSAMRHDPYFGVEQEPVPKTIVVDYGGPNVAKPLHIGHLRSAIIGESMKRIYKFFGNHTIPKKFTSKSRWASAVCVNSTAPEMPKPALFTTMSIRPSRSATVLTAACTCSSRVTSQVRWMIPGWLLSRRLSSYTRHPASARYRAVHCPMPELPPVRRTTVSFFMDTPFPQQLPRSPLPRPKWIRYDWPCSWFAADTPAPAWQAAALG